MREQIVEARRQAANQRLTRNSLWNTIPGLGGRPYEEYWEAEQRLWMMVVSNGDGGATVVFNFCHPSWNRRLLHRSHRRLLRRQS